MAGERDQHASHASRLHGSRTARARTATATAWTRASHLCYPGNDFHSACCRSLARKARQCDHHIHSHGRTCKWEGQGVDLNTTMPRAALAEPNCRHPHFFKNASLLKSASVDRLFGLPMVRENAVPRTRNSTRGRPDRATAMSKASPNSKKVPASLHLEDRRQHWLYLPRTDFRRRTAGCSGSTTWTYTRSLPFRSRG